MKRIFAQLLRSRLWEAGACSVLALVLLHSLVITASTAWKLAGDNEALGTRFRPHFEIVGFRMAGLDKDMETDLPTPHRELIVVSSDECYGCWRSEPHWLQIVSQVHWWSSDRVTWVTVGEGTLPATVMSASAGRVAVRQTRVVDVPLFVASSGIGTLPMTVVVYGGRVVRVVAGALAEDTAASLARYLNGTARESDDLLYLPAVDRTPVHTAANRDERVADCTRYDPTELRVTTSGNHWRVEDASAVVIARASTAADADRMRALAVQHTAVCYIGRTPDEPAGVLQYWLPDAAAVATENEDCVQHEPNGLRIERGSLTEWRLVSTGRRLLVVRTEVDATAAWQWLRKHRQRCFIGRDNTRPDRRPFMVQYWR